MIMDDFAGCDGFCTDVVWGSLGEENGPQSRDH